MLAGQDMRHITVHLMREDLPQASLAMAEMGAFEPDQRALLADALPEVPGQTFRDLIVSARGRYQRLVDLVGEPEDHQPFLVLRREQLQEMDQWLELAWSQCSRCKKALHALHDRAAELEQQLQSLNEFMDLDIDLSQLHNRHEFFDLVIGTIPAANLSRLREALALSGHLIIRTTGGDDTKRIVVAGARRPRATLNNVLSAAGFESTRIPPSFHAQPVRVQTELLEEQAGLDEMEKMLLSELENWRSSNQEQMAKARQLLAYAEPYVQVQDAARANGGLAALQGWLPAGHIERTRSLLQQHLNLPFLLEVRRPRPEEAQLVPVAPAQSRWLRSFSALVRQYGVPRFGEFEPTLLFAVTFALMFGMMFGDVGHGLVFLGAGLLARKRLGDYTTLPVLAGASAILFGFLYGSIFGIEHWLTPLWIAPLSDPKQMLSVALAWGVVFLTLGSMVAIYNRLHNSDLIAALFDAGGLFSLLFYYGLLSGLLSLVRGDGFGIGATAVMVISLLPLIVYRWQASDAPLGERSLIVFIEMFEMVSAYLSNSLSFLRVAAFGINHVALSLAVLTLAGASQGIGHWAILLFGNLFVIVLEGMIVTIQTLRLEYYEGFSRFFYGDGRPFRPLRLATQQPAGLFSQSVPRKGLSNEVSS